MAERCFVCPQHRNCLVDQGGRIGQDGDSLELEVPTGSELVQLDVDIVEQHYR
ncbi:MAG TPA: hypothetical protein VJU54_10380 [Nitrospiraceae bacterium]|nr:hypothetical protein [Nitrospiraceae bacterium]